MKKINSQNNILSTILCVSACCAIASVTPVNAADFVMPPSIMNEVGGNMRTRY